MREHERDITTFIRDTILMIAILPYFSFAIMSASPAITSHALAVPSNTVFLQRSLRFTPDTAPPVDTASVLLDAMGVDTLAGFLSTAKAVNEFWGKHQPLNDSLMKHSYKRSLNFANIGVPLTGEQIFFGVPKIAKQYPEFGNIFAKKPFFPRAVRADAQYRERVIISWPSASADTHKS